MDEKQSQKIYSFDIYMLEQLKKLLFSTYSPQDKIGLFFSLFDKGGKLLASHGVVKSDKPLETMLDLLYTGIIKTHEATVQDVVFDIVEDIQIQKDISAFLQLSPVEYGVLLEEMDGTKSGVLLPNMVGIQTMQQALATIKKKYELGGNVTISTFKTKRIIFSK